MLGLNKILPERAGLGHAVLGGADDRFGGKRRRGVRG
jgi:hypothetical protein